MHSFYFGCEQKGPVDFRILSIAKATRVRRHRRSASVRPSRSSLKTLILRMVGVGGNSWRFPPRWSPPHPFRWRRALDPPFSTGRGGGGGGGGGPRQRMETEA